MIEVSNKVKGKIRGRLGPGIVRPGPDLSILLFTFYFCLFTFAIFLLPGAAAAQDDPADLAPPPLRTVSKDERARLDALTDIKARTKLALEMMNARLVAAEKRSSGGDLDGMFAELGGFHGLMDNSLDFLLKRDTGKGKVLDNFKRLEIGLRGFSPRLETIRRDVALPYEPYIRKLISYIRDARTKASEPLFADTVLPVKKTEP